MGTTKNVLIQFSVLTLLGWSSDAYIYNIYIYIYIYVETFDSLSSTCKANWFIAIIWCLPSLSPYVNFLFSRRISKLNYLANFNKVAKNVLWKNSLHLVPIFKKKWACWHSGCELKPSFNTSLNSLGLPVFLPKVVVHSWYLASISTLKTDCH